MPRIVLRCLSAVQQSDITETEATRCCTKPAHQGLVFFQKCVESGKRHAAPRRKQAYVQLTCEPAWFSAKTAARWRKCCCRSGWGLAARSLPENNGGAGFICRT